MNNKKDGLVSTATLSIIVVVVAGIFILAIIFPLAEAAGGPALQAAITDLCEFNVNVKGSAEFGADIGGQGLHIKDAVPTLLCFNRNRVIYADAWKKCDPENYFGLKDSPNKKAARMRCAAIQVASLAKTCFDMYGSDRLNLRTGEDVDKPFPCFKFKIKHFGKTELSEEAFTSLGMEARGMDQGFCNRNDAAGQSFDNDNFACGNYNNVLYGLNIFSEEFGKSEANFERQSQKDANELKPQVDSLKNQVNSLNLRDSNAVKEFYNKLHEVHNKYKSYPLRKEYMGESFENIVNGFKNQPAVWQGSVGGMLTIMRDELVNYANGLNANIEIHSKGNIMCFNECGGPDLKYICNTEVGGKQGTDAVVINSIGGNWCKY